MNGERPEGAAVPAIVAARRQNGALRATGSQLDRLGKLLKREDLRGKTAMADMRIGV
jgi:hypothetical protein